MKTDYTKRIQYADTRASHWLAEGNQYADQGKKLKAEQCYAKAQYWMDKYNKLRGTAPVRPSA